MADDSRGSLVLIAIDVFFERTPQSKYTIEVLTSLRDIWLNDSELTNYKLEKRISMEYDWKRMPTNPESGLT